MLVKATALALLLVAPPACVSGGGPREAAAPQAGADGPDHDGDLIPDASDECPDYPEDDDGVEDGDGCPEASSDDQDGDGFDDAVDSCPDIPEDDNDFQDRDGCPLIDRDKDGVDDHLDHCIGQLEDMDGVEDGDGCPE